MSLGVSAQKTTRDANGNYIAVKTITKASLDSSSLIPTGKTYKDEDGNIHPVYKGRDFVIMTSKKTGNKYKKYL